VPPQAWHTPPLQTPVVHAAPGQHGWFAPPQAVHVPAEQAWPDAQTPPRQHGCPAPPQSLHLPLPHESPESQRWLAQQGSPLPPHVTHELAPLHTSPSPQRSPLPRHTFADGTLVSQQPVLHSSPGQHGCPLPPQPAHRPDDASQRSPL
jgi:hypothetical protein